MGRESARSFDLSAKIVGRSDDWHSRPLAWFEHISSLLLVLFLFFCVKIHPNLQMSTFQKYFSAIGLFVCAIKWEGRGKAKSSLGM